MPDPDDFGPQPPANEASTSSTETGSRILALDVGDRRIGLALSDPLGFTAQPLFTLHRTQLRADLKSIARLIRKHSISDLVVGLPVHSSGAMSPQAIKTQAFADALREQHPTVRLHLLDERFTTAEAHTILDQAGRSRRSKADRQQRTAIIDQVAAVLLLEAFLSTSSPRLLPPPPDF